MKRAWHRRRLAAHLSRRMQAQAVFSAAMNHGAQEGAAAFADGAEAPPEPSDAPSFSCCWPWWKRHRALRVGRAHSYVVGFWVGWQMAEGAQALFAEFFGTTSIETTADQMVREAEAYANRGRS